jgi:heterodisulfide reductase subunit A
MEHKKIVTVKIDGHEVQAERGTPIIKLAAKLGIYIPTLCYHDFVEPYGSCRVCSVEMRRGKRRRLVTACNYPAQDGEEIYTDTEWVRENRRLILELLLARCPEVPVIKEMAAAYGVTETRFEKLYSDCINCGLCVRICSEVVGANAIGWAGRGVNREVTTPFEIDPQSCIGCGACAAVCPTGRIRIEPLWAIKEGEPREFTLGPSSAIYIPTYQAVPKVPVIDPEACIHFKTGGCQICARVCEPKAIDHNQEERLEEFEVGQILVATGYELFNPAVMKQYGYGRLDDVYTSLEMEYMFNSSGPTNGRILMKNGEPPRSIGIIHCIGSRDANHHPYCSRICCMYALKFAHLIKDRSEAEVYQFYIDMRAFGKGYEEFFTRILDEGVNVIRGRVAEVVKASPDKAREGKLLIRCEDTLVHRFREIPVDMVVLCSAIEPQKDAERLQRLFSLSRSPDGFFLEKHPKLDPTATPTDGVYIAGCCQGPKDIPDTVAQASSAAARILANIAKGVVEVAPIVAYIDPEICAGCRLCLQLCPYGAIEYLEEKGISQVNEALCKGCGTCVSACPSGASTQRHFRDEQIWAEIEGLLLNPR